MIPSSFSPLMRSFACSVILLSFFVSCSKSVSQEGQSSDGIAVQDTLEETNLVSYPGRSFSYSAKFCDRNAKHLDAASRIGLHPAPQNRAAAAKMKGKLREVRSNKNYIVDSLTYSIPYLVPKAASRLDAIGEEFADLLQRNDLPHYRFHVSSVLRTQDDIRCLQRTNCNATENSAHNYGTTFDIAYYRYDKSTRTHDYMSVDNLKLALGQVLLNQQRAGHIYVKYEYKQCCFHITVRD